MKNVISKLSIVMIMLLGILIISGTESKAASFDAKISATTVTVGESVIVTLTANNAAGMYSVTKNNNNLSVTSGSTEEWLENASTKITFKAEKEGTTTITAQTKDMTDFDENDVKVTKTFNVTVKAKEETKQPENTNSGSTNNNNSENTGSSNNQSKPTTTKSNNSKLKMLGIRPHDFKNFKSGTTTYYVSVPNDTEEVEVYAEKQESSQKISGTGKVKLKEGSNTVKVVCTAEDGTTKTYTMYITREKAEEQTTSETEEPKQEEPTTEEQEPTEEKNNAEETSNEAVIGITNLTITGKNEKGETVKLELAPDFNELVGEYSVTVPLTITEVNVLAEAQEENPTVEVMGNKDLVEGENTVTVMVTVGENKKVFQITVIRTADSATSLSNEVVMQLAIIAAIATIIIVAIIAIIIMIVRSHKKKKEKYSKVDIELGDMSKLKVDEPETEIEQENKEE